MKTKIILSIVAIAFVAFLNSCSESKSTDKSDLFSLLINDNNGNPRIENLNKPISEVKKSEDINALDKVTDLSTNFEYKLDSNGSYYNIDYTIYDEHVGVVDIELSLYPNDDETNKEKNNKKSEALYQKIIDYLNSNYGAITDKGDNAYSWEFTPENSDESVLIEISYEVYNEGENYINILIQ